MPSCHCSPIETQRAVITRIDLGRQLRWVVDGRSNTLAHKDDGKTKKDRCCSILAVKVIMGRLSLVDVGCFSFSLLSALR